MEEKRKKRSEIDNKYKWDLEKMYKTINDWHKDLDKLQALTDELVKMKGSLTKNSNVLYEGVTKYDELDRLLVNLYVYAKMKNDEDTTNNEVAKIKGTIEKVVTNIGEKTVFFTNELVKCDESIIDKYMNEEPRLNQYKFFFEQIFRNKKHILSENEEVLLAGANEILNSAGNIRDTIVDTDFKFDNITIDGKKIELTESMYTKLIKHPKQSVRKRVFKTYYKAFGSFKHTFATTMKYNVKSESYISKARKYDSPLQMSLYQNKIEIDVYNNLINTVNDNLHIMHRYINLRKKELGLKELHMYDMYAGIVKDIKQEYSYEQAKYLVKEGLSPLGEEYQKLLDRAFDEKWIDVYDNIGKTSGAYSFGSYDSYPYILMNFNGTLNSVETLAHELGHSMHSYYTNSTQPYTYSHYAIFTAEVASTVNEILLNKYMVSKASSNKEKKIILNELLEKFRGTLIRQTMFAEFEKIIFESEANNEVLTEDLISDIYYNLNKKYYGKDIIHDEEIRYEWMRIPHFYSPFYVYQYATGISAACAIASDILSGKKGARENYFKFLKSGRSDYPINLLKIAGVDMSSKEPIEKALKMFNDTIDEFINLKD
jgi:oligoendopeptidase F